MTNEGNSDEIVAAILTSSVLRANAKPHAKLAVETYRIVLDLLQAEHQAATPPAPPAPAPAVAPEPPAEPPAAAP